MTRLEKIQLALQKGFKYEPETGLIYNKNNRIITSKHTSGYTFIALYENKKQHMLLGHHFAWYWVNNEIVDLIDHIDRDTTNNKISNLRSSNNQKNCFNSKAKGYSYCKYRNKYKSSIVINRKKIFLGRFLTKEEAINAYLEAKKIYHIQS